MAKLLQNKIKIKGIQCVCTCTFDVPQHGFISDFPQLSFMASHDLTFNACLMFTCSSDIPRPKRRVSKLLVDTALGCEVTEEQRVRWSAAQREWHLTFLHSPLEFLPATPGGDTVGSVKFALNKLEVTVCALFETTCFRPITRLFGGSFSNLVELNVG